MFKNFSKVLFLLLFVMSNTTFAMNIDEIEGNNCIIRTETIKTDHKEYKNVYIQFHQEADESQLIYSSIFGLNLEDYQMLFSSQQAVNFDKYPFDIRSFSKESTFIVFFYANKSINGEVMNGYRHETVKFHYDLNNR